jgi:hypothetical protein
MVSTKPGRDQLDIARRYGDIRLSVITTSYLEQAHYFRGEYEHVVELATGNLASALPDLVYPWFRSSTPPLIYDRIRLMMSLSRLGRFSEAERYKGEAIHLTQPTHHHAAASTAVEEHHLRVNGHTVGWIHYVAGAVHARKGEWSTARALIEYGITALQRVATKFYFPLP